MNGAVDKAFGKVEFGNPDYDFVHQLKNNNAVFAAYKAHREQNDIIPNLVNDKGQLRSFSDFKKANEHITSKYQHWLKTEYDTSVLRARNAANFKKFERDADLFPCLQWLPSTSVEPRGEHEQFYNIIKPINDPFWSDNYPGDLWNCKCGITNTDKEPTATTPKANYEPTPGLDQNPAYTGAIFSNTNAYITNAYNGANEAVDAFVKREIIKQRRTEIKKEAVELLIGKTVTHNKIELPIEFSVSGIKEALNQPHKYLLEKNEAVLNIIQLVQDAKYIRTDAGISNINLQFHYLKTIIANKTSYIVLKEDITNKKVRFYSIVDNIKKK